MCDQSMKKLIRLAQEQINKTDELLAMLSVDVSENKKNIKTLNEQVARICKYVSKI